MKTSNLFYFVLFVLIISFASCKDKEEDNYIKQNELPSEATAFLGKYLPDNRFISARKSELIDGNQYIYEVNLEGDILVSFGAAGNWLYMQSEKGLPETANPLLSENSQKELKKKYQSAKITALSNNGDGELFIALDNNKKFNDINSHEGYVLAERLDAEDIRTIPEKMKAFINQFLKADIKATDTRIHPYVLKFSGFRGSIYRLSVANQAIVDFYDNGEWFYMKNTGTQKLIQNLFIKAIPEDLVKVLVGKHPNASSSLIAVTLFNNKKLYGFDLGDKNFVVINSENKIIEPPLDKAKEYIKKGFNPDKELQYEVRSNTSSPYFLRYAFIVTGQGTISLVTDVEGNMQIINAGPITNRPETVPLPKAVLEMLPSEINSYLKINYPNEVIISVSHSYSINQDDIPDEINLTMPIPNNLKKLIFDYKTGEFIRDYNVIGER